MTPLVLDNPLENGPEQRIFGARRQHGVAFQRRQFLDCAPRQVGRMKMAREVAHQRRPHLLEPLPKRGVAFDLNVPVAANLHARGFEKFTNGPAVKVFFIGPARQKRDGLRIVDDACAQHRPQVNDRARLDVHHVFQAPDLVGRQCILPCLREVELGQIHLSRIFQIIFQIERSHRTLPFQ